MIPEGTRTISLPLNGGVDEISAVNKTDLKNCLKMENWRISRDGARYEKRLGLAEEVTDFGEDVYGYSTYYNASGTFCQLAVLETKIMRKVGSGAWASIHSFSSSIAHPVRPLEVQGKQFVITEIDSRMVHTDGSDYQLGIAAPTTLPTNATTYPTEDTLPLNDTFAYANTAAMDAVWTDGDAGNGQSTIATSGPATQGPDAHGLYLKLTSSSVSATSVAKRSLTVGTTLGSKYTIELNSYFDVIRGVKNVRDFQIKVYNGAFRLPLYFLKGNLCIYDSKGKQLSFTTNVVEDKWVAWKFVVDGTDSTAVSVSAYKDGVFLKTVTYGYADTTNTDLVEIIGNSKATTGVVSVFYVDNLKITTDSPTAAVKQGDYRYAMTYFRGGNYGCESNPIRSKIGSVTFTGSGLNDMTVSGEYSGVTTKTFRVYVETTPGTPTPDTFKWSEDSGVTWNSTTLNMTTAVYLNYGIVLAFAAVVGHTATNYWEFTCSVCSASPVNQVVTLSSVPTSLDPQVTGRKIYRTVAGGSDFFWLATLNDNVQTTFIDNIPDLALAVAPALETDHDVVPNGKFAAWWDERLWVSGDNIVYDSQISYPEHMDTSARYVTIQKGDTSDEIMGLMPYKDSLYVFRKKSLHVIQKTYDGYGRFLVLSDIGCIAPWSLVEVNNTLMFVSHRGIEIFNGADVTGLEPSLPIDRTFRTIDRTKSDLVSAAHYPDKREVWFSFPDLNKTFVYHYLANAWYFFSFYKTPSCLSLCYDATKTPVMKMGTRDGYLDLCESTYRDNTTVITATLRKPWFEASAEADFRRLDMEYEIPATMSLTMNIYANFQKTLARTGPMTGEVLSATDIELRRPHYDFMELGQSARFLSIEFVNAENLGGDLKINEATLYLHETSIKEKTHGD
jgi:hypothetical protein